jgi:hypothetical protein
MKKIIDINSPEDCPKCRVMKDFTTHQTIETICRITESPCGFPDSCPLEEIIIVQTKY